MISLTVKGYHGGIEAVLAASRSLGRVREVGRERHVVALLDHVAERAGPFVSLAIRLGALAGAGRDVSRRRERRRQGGDAENDRAPAREQRGARDELECEGEHEPPAEPEDPEQDDRDRD